MRAKLPRRAALGSKPIAALTIAFVTLLAACQGKGVGGSCADQPGCGGNLVGKWKVNGSCQYLVDLPSTATALPPEYSTPQTPSLATPVPQTNTGDFCEGLIVLPVAGGGVKVAHTDFFQPPSMFTNNGTLEFDAGGMYTFSLTSVAEGTAHITQACIEAHGASTDCAGLQAALLDFPNPNYSPNLTCTSAGDGCDCDVQLGDSGFDSGAWVLDSTQTVVYETSTNGDKGPRAASFCVTSDNDELTLSGYNGATLAGGPAGLRTLTATRIATTP